MGEQPAEPDLAAGLNRLPLAALILAPDGSAVAVNAAWAELSGLSGHDSRGEGWLRGLDRGQRQPLRARLRAASAAGEHGCADCQLAERSERQWTRWWWRARPGGGLLVCVAGISTADADRMITPDPPGDGRAAADGPPANGQPPGTVPELDTRIELASVLIHRIFGVGLTLESALGLVTGPAAVRIQQAVDALDTLIRDIRSYTLRLPLQAEEPAAREPPAGGPPAAGPPRAEGPPLP
ncbi:MAG: hypothetical protein J2P35_00235 [Actinobacteria bacterium]|nr:hypothetical protein [Actinomycetota bacterium]MBO0787295.1 hypothetical protein [Actinomycetota bacterium]